MDKKNQVEILNSIKEIKSFKDKISDNKNYPLSSKSVDILQINVGKKCNLECKHCHVKAGPGRTEIMPKKVLEKCLEIIKNSDISTIDITGGAPEMNPNLEWFISEASRYNKRFIVRSNLVILLNDKYKKFIDIFTKYKIEIVTSLPDYINTKSDRQRGPGIFKQVIEAIRILNNRGYGQENSGLILDIVHNPVGAYLPGSQKALEHEYKTRLKSDHNLLFNNLFSITNIPVGRYLDYLISSGNFDDYFNDLYRNYNPEALNSVMCKNTLSVGWDGTLYDCDFNQMLNLPININGKSSIFDVDFSKLKNREIIIGNHCYGCVAGSGSSCQGAIVE